MYMLIFGAITAAVLPAMSQMHSSSMLAKEQGEGLNAATIGQQGHTTCRTYTPTSGHFLLQNAHMHAHTHNHTHTHTLLQIKLFSPSGKSVNITYFVVKLKVILMVVHLWKHVVC